MKNLSVPEVVVKKCNSILSFDASEWAKIQDSNPDNNYAWLLGIESDTNTSIAPIYYYLKSQGTLIGIAVCYEIGRKDYFRSPDDNFLGRGSRILSRLNLRFSPLIMCGHLKGEGCSILISEKVNKGQRIEILQKLIIAIEADAFHKSKGVLFSKILPENIELDGILVSAGYVKTINLPIAYIDVKWTSIEGYKEYIRRHLSKKAKSNIVSEMNRANRENVQFSFKQITDSNSYRVYELIKGNYKKYETRKFPFKNSFIKNLYSNNGDNCILLAAHKKNKLSGVSMTIRKNEVAKVKFVGVDHMISKNDKTYFNLIFYYLFEIANSFGLKRIYFGNGLYKAKIKRGCSMLRNYEYYKSDKKINHFIASLWLKIHRLLLSQKFKAFNNYYADEL